LERVKAGIQNYRKFQALFSRLLEQEEEQVLSGERGVLGEGKKNSRKRFKRV
jgi:hypothetical protein